MHTYQSPEGLLAADRTGTETAGAQRTKLTLTVTPLLQTICRSIYLSTFTRIDETERRYVLDVANGRYQTVDLARLALAARRSTRHANHTAIATYVATLGGSEPSALPFDRALLRKVREEGEANTAVERFRYQPSLVAADRAITEIDDSIAATHDVRQSLVVERSKLTA